MYFHRLIWTSRSASEGRILITALGEVCPVQGLVPSPTLIRPGPGETLIPVLNPGPGAPIPGPGRHIPGHARAAAGVAGYIPRLLSALADYEFRPETGLAVGHSRLLFGDAKGAAAIAD